ncbi:response regulator transcription factor [Nitrosomonas sp. Nm33]|uniref:response regulator n=1 Tax=Nitrosomonas sp. Nm33 TaxID=133724 RepID=UPI000897866B|nr:response regulator transcription factor [Nitrosomonas sp. Nm33]SDY18035.1 DNA-binding response regulator, NarL/FixJ family, contains REC and HTH domains [Nitrosomonas sp. Nm33]
MMTPTINTMIVEDHDIVASGIREILRTAVPMVNVVATAKNADEAWSSIKNNKIHFVIMDIRLDSKLNGISLTSEFIKEYPDLAILIYSGENNEEVVRRAINAGARGYVPKGAGIENLKKGIEIIVTGGSYLDPSLPRQQRYVEPLTSKEEEVLKLIAEEKKDEEISQELNIVSTTVRTHRANIMSKRCLKNAVELYQYAIKCYPN